VGVGATTRWAVMWIRGGAWGVVLLPLVVVAAVGQTGAPRDHSGLAAPGGRACEVCHGAHSGPVGYILRVDDQGTEIAMWLSTQAPGAETSASCLRCHWNEEVRLRQPDLGVVSPGGGGYLGPDLADDHPLGDVARFGGGGAPAGPPVIECKLCHDPHDATRLVVPVGEEVLRCGTCHSSQAQQRQEHTQVVCSACHEVHNSFQGQLLFGFTVEDTCVRCHTPSGLPSSTLDSLVALGKTPALSTPSHNPGANCTQCHGIHSGSGP
jgi:predicted CXXCH cytochrome family protein